MIAGETTHFSIPIGSLLTVTTVDGEAYLNPISDGGVVGDTLRIWSGEQSITVGPFARTTVYRVTVLLGEAIVAQTLFDVSIGGVQEAVDELTRTYIKDDFVGGSVALFAGEIGELGWFGNQLGSGAVESPAMTTADVGHPGVKRLTTGATLNSQAFIHLPSTSAFNLFLVDEAFDLRFVVNLRQDDTNTKAAFGLGTTPAPPALSGVRIEKDFSDTDWHAFTGNASSTTRVSLGAVTAGGWERFRIRRVPGGIGFTRNNNPEVTIATTILASGTGVTISVYLENNATSSKQLDVDFIDLLVSGLTR